MFLARQVAACVDPALLAVLEAVDLASGKMQGDRPQLDDDSVMAAGRVGLPFERPQLAPHFAQEIREAQQVALGGLESPLSFLAAFAELQDAGRFFDDRPAVLGTGV